MYKSCSFPVLHKIFFEDFHWNRSQFKMFNDIMRSINKLETNTIPLCALPYLLIYSISHWTAKTTFENFKTYTQAHFHYVQAFKNV